MIIQRTMYLSVHGSNETKQVADVRKYWTYVDKQLEMIRDDKENNTECISQ